jgi:protease I
MSQPQLPLQGIRVAILVDNGFEQIEMERPRQALEQAGAKTVLISPQKEKVQAAKHDEKGDEFAVDLSVNDASPSDYDALLIPGGVRSPDQMRTNNKAVLFVQAFEIAKKPTAVICHGPWMLVEAGSARGRKLTSWPSLRTDITNAGGQWVDEVVVRDGLLVTSRKPDDIPAFNKAMIELFASARGSGYATLA